MGYIVSGLLFVCIGWKFGDLKNVRKYYSTILFFITGDLLYNVLTYNHPAWSYHKDVIFPNHTLINLWIMITLYPATVSTYLGYFPKKKNKQFTYILSWIIIYIVGELLCLHVFRVIDHLNGWNMWWSALFDTIIFVLLPIHHKRPLLAWGLSIIVIIFFLTVFNINIRDMR